MLARPSAALTALIVVVTACGGGPSPSLSPAASPAPTGDVGTPSPSASGPAATLAPDQPADEPSAELPEPTLTEPFAIASALASPTQRLQGVVSMLAGLGIGVVDADGQAVLDADETVQPVLRLSEDEVHGLAEMAVDAGPFRIPFSAWHAALAELGVDLSADELALAFEETYFAGFETSFVGDLLSATGVELYADGTLTHLQAWLLLLDGFVIRQSATSGIVLATNHETNRWGGASTILPDVVIPGEDLSPEQRDDLLAHLVPMLYAVPLHIAPSPASVHEGHGGPGDPLELALRFQPANVRSFPDQPYFMPNPAPKDLPIQWAVSNEDERLLKEHGQLLDGQGADLFNGPGFAATDGDGEIRLTYRPREEEANGEGERVEEVVRIAATVELRAIAERVWLLPPALIGFLDGHRRVQTELTIEWHEVAGIRIDAVDEYDVNIDMLLGNAQAVGTDRLQGFLALQDDGTYRGMVDGTADAVWRSDILGQECSTPLTGRQKLLAVAELVPPDDEGRDLEIRFYPAADPQVGQLRCQYDLSRWEGNEYDPNVPPDRWLPAREYAPFNDIRITMPEDRGLRANYPASGGSRTIEYTERAAGLGGGTWTITVEEVEPAP